MEEAAATVAEAGIEPHMALATVQRQRWAAQFPQAADAGSTIAMVDAILAAMTATTPRSRPRDHRLPRPLHDGAPAPHNEWREAQLAAFLTGGPAPDYPRISDDEIRETIETNQLRLLRERGADMTIFSPRASAMAHHEGDLGVGIAWSYACNDLIARVVDLFPDHVRRRVPAPAVRRRLARRRHRRAAALRRHGVRRAATSTRTRVADVGALLR